MQRLLSGFTVFERGRLRSLQIYRALFALDRRYLLTLFITMKLWAYARTSSVFSRLWLIELYLDPFSSLTGSLLLSVSHSFTIIPCVFSPSLALIFSPLLRTHLPSICVCVCVASCAQEHAPRGVNTIIPHSEDSSRERPGDVLFEYSAHAMQSMRWRCGRYALTTWKLFGSATKLFDGESELRLWKRNPVSPNNSCRCIMTYKCMSNTRTLCLPVSPTEFHTGDRINSTIPC